MGKAIEALALKAGESIGSTINSGSTEAQWKLAATCDVAIEFTHPAAARQNLLRCAEHRLPTVCGTTGWQSHVAEVSSAFAEGCLVHSTNFSVGVLLFWHLSQKLAAATGKSYRYELEEWHHHTKADSPSGTAITTAEGILSHQQQYTGWNLGRTENEHLLPITAHREGDVKGIHELKAIGANDQLVLRHEAFNRDGFASGALVAANFALRHRGVFTMSQVLGIQ